MNRYEILRRLEAYRAGRPVPRGSTIHFPISADPHLLKLAFVRMGGESAPWGVAWKRGEGRLHVRCVPEPRNRTDVADMMAEFAPALLEHLRHPAFPRPTVSGPSDASPHRQIWLPNASHLAMLHFLAYAYTRTRFGEEPRRSLLRTLGRACGWLFRESTRPGQIRVMDASATLRESYSFPADNVRQQHTGYLLAWLRTNGDLKARLAAATEAEQLSVATTLDPAFERDVLEELNRRYREAREAGDTRTMAALSKEMTSKLAPELVRRVDLVEATITVLQTDRRKRSAGIIALESESREEFWYQYLRGETDGTAEQYAPSPETDHNPTVAASRYHMYEGSESLRLGALLQDDADLQAEAIAEGQAFRGTIVEVRDEGSGRASVPVWRVESGADLPLRLRRGDRVCPADFPRRVGEIRAVHRNPSGGHRLEVEIRSLKTMPRGPAPRGLYPAADQRYQGRSVTLIQGGAGGISKRKGSRVWKTGLPGSWLTHHRPARRERAAAIQEEGADE